MTLMSNAVMRSAEIRRHRSADMRNAVLLSVFQLQILYWAWVIGWSFGPSKLALAEMGIGASFSFALGLVSSWMGLRRYLEREALFRFRAREAKKRRRIVVFDDHLWCDDDVLVLSEVLKFQRDSEGFSLEYRPSTGAKELHRSFVCSKEAGGWLKEYFVSAGIEEPA